MIRALLVLLAFARFAWADAGATQPPAASNARTDAAGGEADLAADRAFQAAMQRAVAGDASAIDAFEALGAERPVTRWTDDAWAEAARLAERTGDYARARRDYEQIVALDAAAASSDAMRAGQASEAPHGGSAGDATQGGDEATATQGGGPRPDPKQVARAKAALARLSSDTGNGRWDAVTREHERLVSTVFGGDDPRDELAQLEAIVARYPDYPRVNAIRLALGRGWEEEGEQARALRWWHAAADAEPAARVPLIRALIRAGHLDDAESELERAEAIAATQQRGGSKSRSTAVPGTAPAPGTVSTTGSPPGAVPGTVSPPGAVPGTVSTTAGRTKSAPGTGSVSGAAAVSSASDAGAIIDRTALAFARQALETAKRRAWIARGLWALLLLAAVGAVIVLRRAEGSWRAVGKRVVVPPMEVVFLIPIAGVLVAIASTGNPLAARAVTWIAIAGVVIAWVSGVVLDASRARGPLRAPRIAAQVMAVVMVVGAAGYLAVLRSGSLDLILETWRGGHALR